MPLIVSVGMDDLINVSFYLSRCCEYPALISSATVTVEILALDLSIFST